MSWPHEWGIFCERGDHTSVFFRFFTGEVAVSTIRLEQHFAYAVFDHEDAPEWSHDFIDNEQLRQLSG
jgi:hypothetical protein